MWTSSPAPDATAPRTSVRLGGSTAPRAVSGAKPWAAGGGVRRTPAPTDAGCGRGRAPGAALGAAVGAAVGWRLRVVGFAAAAVTLAFGFGFGFAAAAACAWTAFGRGLFAAGGSAGGPAAGGRFGLRRWGRVVGRLERTPPVSGASGSVMRPSSRTALAAATAAPGNWGKR